MQAALDPQTCVPRARDSAEGELLMIHKLIDLGCTLFKTATLWDVRREQRSMRLQGAWRREAVRVTQHVECLDDGFTALTLLDAGDVRERRFGEIPHARVFVEAT